MRQKRNKKGKRRRRWRKQREISTLLIAVSSVFFTVTFPDPQQGTVTKTMYVGDRTAPAYVYDTKTKQVKWSGLKINFIEK